MRFEKNETLSNFNVRLLLFKLCLRYGNEKVGKAFGKVQDLMI